MGAFEHAYIDWSLQDVVEHHQTPPALYILKEVPAVAKSQSQALPDKQAVQVFKQYFNSTSQDVPDEAFQAAAYDDRVVTEGLYQADVYIGGPNYTDADIRLLAVASHLSSLYKRAR